MKGKPDKAHCDLVAGLALICDLRDTLAGFLARHGHDPEHLIQACDDNGWNESVAYDLRDGLFRLGTVLADLVVWDEELDIPASVRNEVRARRGI